MPRLEDIANVALRVPCILALDLLYKCDIESFTEHLRAKSDDMLFKYKYLIWNVYYLGHLCNLVVLILPLGHIVTLYLHALTAMLLYLGHQISRDYVRGEVQYGYDGLLFLDAPSFNRFLTTLSSQVIVSTLCAFLMRSRRVWLFSAHLLPLLARVCCVPSHSLLTLTFVSMAITGAVVAGFLLTNLFLPYRLVRAACQQLLQLEVVEVYRVVAVGMSLWQSCAVPVLFSVFWCVLFGVQLCSTISTPTASQQGVLFYLLSSVSECCGTPYSLLGLAFVVSYAALGLLTLSKWYLGGFTAVHNHNVMHRGVTEGVTLLLLGMQTGLCEMTALQRSFLLSIFLFIILTSTLQSITEITHTHTLALGASRNRNVWKHVRGLSMCLFLLVFPGFMAIKLSLCFHIDFWLLILLSSCLLTSLQVIGTLLIYTLFLVEFWHGTEVPGLDEVVYYVNGVCRGLELGLAVCVCVYGAWESLFGEWSWLGASVIIIHSYCSVWVRARAGWRSFLLRREAARRISSLPQATTQQLHTHNDVCSICFQDMSSAVVTYCGHFFHGSCLRKWLYVQVTCPMCHTAIKPSAPPPQNPIPAAGHAQTHPPDTHTHPIPRPDSSDPDPEEQREPPGLMGDVVARNKKCVPVGVASPAQSSSEESPSHSPGPAHSSETDR